MPEFKERQLVTDPQKAFHFTDLQRLKPTRANDPYEYQHGWGNRHQSEVIPGTLPVAQNNPHEVRFGLYTEGITYSAFAAPRAHNFSTYMYRCRPAAAHSTVLPSHWLARTNRYQMATYQSKLNQTSRTASSPSIPKLRRSQNKQNGVHSHYRKRTRRSISRMDFILLLAAETRTSGKV
jgi:homogentisate 1,2-dioxygenase